MLRYYSVQELTYLNKVDEVTTLARSLWYRLTEGVESIPDSYEQYNGLLRKYKINGWNLSIHFGNAVIYKKVDSLGIHLIKVDRNGKESYKIL